MQTVTDLYRELLAAGAGKEIRLLVAGEVYGEDRICSMSTTASLFAEDSLCVGSAVARQIDVVLIDYGEIPRMAELIPQYRLTDGVNTTDWISKGVFYIDTRQADKVMGTLTIHGFDAMLKGSVIWVPDQALEFPMTFRKAAGVLAELMGVTLDNPEDINDTYQILDYPANDYTVRNVLQFIAAAHAANFVMTDTGLLRMVPINKIPPPGGVLVTENGNAITFGGVRILVGEAGEGNYGDGDAVFVGDRAASVTLSPAFDPISKVIVKVDEENAWVAGDDSGFALQVTCPYGTQAMADNILDAVGGFVYQPFSAEDAIIDPAAELGDGITVGGVYSQLAQQDVVFDRLMAGRVSAPGQKEVESEYPYQTKEQQIDYKLAQTRSEITKTAEEITQRVESVEGAMSEFTVSLNGLSGRVEDAEGKVAEVELTVGGFSTSIKDLETGLSSSLVVNEDGAVFTSAGESVIIDGGSIDASTINANQVSASTLYGNQIILRDGPYSYQQPGYIMLTSASTADYAVEVHSDGALRLVADTGAAWFEAGPSKLALSGSEANAIFHEKITPVNSGLYSIGDATFKWSAVYATTGTIQTSDRNAKHDIEALPEKYVQLVLWLAPKRYKLNDGTSGRYHVGFIAQDVEEGMSLFGIDSLEFGGFVKASDENGNDIYMLRYEEFIAIILAAVQKQQKVIDDHEERLKKLEAMMNG